MAATDRVQWSEGVRLGPETSYGTSVAATRILSSVDLTFEPKPKVTTFMPSGSIVPTVAATNQEETTGKISGQPAYNELPYLLCGNVASVSPTTPGGATLSRQWQWTPVYNTFNPPKSYTVEAGNNSSRGSYASGILFPELGFEFSKNQQGGSVAASGTVMGQTFYDDKVRFVVTTGTPAGGTFTITVGAQTTAGIAYNAAASAVQTAVAALSNVGTGNVIATGGPMGTAPVRLWFTGTYDTTLVPTVTASGASLTGGTSPAATASRLASTASAIPLVPVTAQQFDIYASTSWAGLAGASKLTRAFKANWKFSGRFGGIFSLNTAFLANSDYVESKPQITAGFSVGADDTGMGFLGQLRANTPVFLRIKATGPSIEANFTHSWITDICMLLKTVSDVKVESNIIARDFAGDMAYDATSGNFFQSTVITTLTAL